MMAEPTGETCAICGNQIFGNIKSISFEHTEFTFRIAIIGLHDCPECKKREFIELFQSSAEGFVALHENKIIVDWKFFSVIYRDVRENTISVRRRWNVIDVLLALGIFSREREGNWVIGTDGIILNPRLTIGYV